jgi:hypothetical protein
MVKAADALGGVAKLAEKTKLSATTLYRTLSRKGNPELSESAVGLHQLARCSGSIERRGLDQCASARRNNAAPRINAPNQ